MSALYLALVHHPVRDRAGATITTAVTNLDVHDIARTARTFGLAGYYLVTPVAAQQRLVGGILEHWRTGASARRTPERSEALSLVRIVPSVQAAVADISRETSAPFVVATGASLRNDFPIIQYSALRERIDATNPPPSPLPQAGGGALGGDRKRPILLLFGTGHGLSHELAVDAVLPPIRAASDYNHLSVRAAVAITLDRVAC